MSLTSIMKGGFSKVVIDSIPIPNDRFKSSKNCVACPKTKNYSLIGTAFDYLVRSELKRLYPNAIENKFIAESSIALVEQNIKEYGYYQAKNERIGKKELDAMRSIERKYKEERMLFIKSGNLTNSFIETTIRFARMDVIFRAGIYDDVEKNVDPLDIEDLRALYNLIPVGLKKSASNNIILNPNFGFASLEVGGADADLIIDSKIIDIKTTKEMRLDAYSWSQIVGYLILADEVREIEKNFPVIERIGIYFSRYGYLWDIDADYVRKNHKYRELKANLLNINTEIVGKAEYTAYENNEHNEEMKEQANWIKSPLKQEKSKERKGSPLWFKTLISLILVPRIIIGLVGLGKVSAIVSLFAFIAAYYLLLKVRKKLTVWDYVLIVIVTFLL